MEATTFVDKVTGLGAWDARLYLCRHSAIRTHLRDGEHN